MNMNKIKKILSSLGLCSLSFLLFSCGGFLQIGTDEPSNGNSDVVPSTNTSETEALSQQEKIYQLAKASGYSGTYEQWLESIKGDQVVIAVINNKLQWRYASESSWNVLLDLSVLQGEDGHTPYIGANGNWWINGTDTGVNAGGQNGQDGQDGKDGQDGLTPYIGYNGNWWIGNNDTGVSASGQNGQDGKIQADCCD